MFSVTLSVALRPPVFHWYLLLRSPDFPLAVFAASDCLLSRQNDDYALAIRLRRRLAPEAAPSTAASSGCQ